MSVCLATLLVTCRLIASSFMFHFRPDVSLCGKSVVRQQYKVHDWPCPKPLLACQFGHWVVTTVALLTVEHLVLSVDDTALVSLLRVVVVTPVVGRRLRSKKLSPLLKKVQKVHTEEQTTSVVVFTPPYA